MGFGCVWVVGDGVEDVGLVCGFYDWINLSWWFIECGFVVGG